MLLWVITFCRCLKKILSYKLRNSLLSSLYPEATVRRLGLYFLGKSLYDAMVFWCMRVVSILTFWAKVVLYSEALL